MKNNKILIMLTVVFSEIIAFFGLTKLTDLNDFIWIGVAVVVLATIITAYFLFSEINEKLQELTAEKKTTDEQRYNDILKRIESEYSLIDNKITQFMEIQNNYKEINESFNKRQTESFEEFRQMHLNLKSMQENYSLEIKNQYTNNINEFNKMITVSLNNLAEIQRNGINENCSYLKKINENISENIILIGKNIEDNIDKLKSAQLKTLNENKIYIESLVCDTKKQFSDEHTVIQNEYSMLLENINKKFIEISELQSNLFKEQTREFCNNTISYISDSLINGNKELIDKQNSVLNKFLSNSTKNYDNVIQKHLEILASTVNESILQFGKENHSILIENINMTGELLKTEQEFIKYYNEFNLQLNDTLTKGFGKYTDAAVENEEKLETHLEKLQTYLADHYNTKLGEFITANVDSFKKLSQKLAEYSDSFVEKSAIAIGEVQKDNNEQLCKAADSIAALANTDNNFIQHIRENADKTNSQITVLINENKGFLDNLNCITSSNVRDMFENLGNFTSDNIRDMDDIIKNRFAEFSDCVRNLNIEHSNLYAAQMNDYRDKFVEANAKALASVQTDFTESIVACNTKLVELANNIDKTQNIVNKTNDGLFNTVRSLKEILENNNYTLKEQQGEHEDNIKDIFETIQNDVSDNLKNFDDKINTMKKIIESIFNEINKCQMQMNQMNSLTEKDITLLNNLVDGKKK